MAGRSFTGTITRIDARGYGFVQRDGGASFFFHRRHVESWEHLAEGDRVSFEVAPSTRRPDQVEATNIMRL